MTEKTPTYFARGAQVYKMQLGAEQPMVLGGAKLRREQHLTDAAFARNAYPEKAAEEEALAAELAEAITQAEAAGA